MADNFLEAEIIGKCVFVVDGEIDYVVTYTLLHDVKNDVYDAMLSKETDDVVVENVRCGLKLPRNATLNLLRACLVNLVTPIHAPDITEDFLAMEPAYC